MSLLAKLKAKLNEYVKIVPWLQYVGLQVSMIPGIPEKVAAAAVVVSAAAFLETLKQGLGPNDPHLREFLAVGGYSAMAIGMGTGHPLVTFIGFALVMTEILYTVIYP